MWTTIKTMLESKKALTAAVSVVVWLGGKLGLHLNDATLLGAVTPLWAYILAQGVADHGKGAAQVTAAAAADTKPAA
jgi:hypothetical protein